MIALGYGEPAHGYAGEVRVRSAPGRGSRFDTMLPAMTTAGERPAGSPAAPAQADQPGDNQPGDNRTRQ